MKPKPVPPDDVWGFLEEEYQRRVPPPNTFSVSEYAARFSITVPQAQGAINRLEQDGQVVLAGRFGSRNEKRYCLAKLS